ncbi:Ferrichrome receptor FcuA precursor [Raoultella planticola]|nr:Ferrichrome receptor FcuA precursor [Raoultella planticola]
MRSYKLVLLTGMIPCSPILPAMPVYAAETMVVTAEPHTQSLDDVTPAAEQQATAGNLGKQKLINVPWSVQTLSDSLTRQVQASSVKDVYRYLPSVQGDGVRPQTRGMQGSVVQNSMIDGLNVVSTTEYPAEQFQRIEVLNGMAGALYGPANPAGMFNLVSKRPTDVPLRRVTVGGGTASGANAALDLSGPLDAADRVKYRLNLLDQDGSSYTHGSRQRNQYAGLALDFQLTDQTVLESNFSYYHFYQKGLPGSFALAKGTHFPSPLDPTKSQYGQYYAGNDDTTTTGSPAY